MNPGTADTSAGELEGIPAVEPAFGLPARWIAPELRDHAEVLGYTVVDPTSVITTHLSEVIRQHAPSILSRQDVQALLDGVKDEHPALVGELVPDLLSIGEVQKVLQHLLSERITIRDLVTILESLADTARTTRDPDQLGERVRQALGRAISRQNLGLDGRLSVLTLSPTWQQSLNAVLQGTVEGDGARGRARPQPDPAVSGSSAAGAATVHRAVTQRVDDRVVQRGGPTDRSHDTGCGRRCRKYLSC